MDRRPMKEKPYIGNAGAAGCRDFTAVFCDGMSRPISFLACRMHTEIPCFTMRNTAFPVFTLLAVLGMHGKGVGPSIRTAHLSTRRRRGQAH
jgi:hypothetical protein